MSIHYFVRNHDCPEKKIYIITDKNLSYIRGNFKLENGSHVYSIKNVEIELDNLFIYIIPMFILALIGMLIHPFAMIIGSFIGFIISYSQIRIDESQFKKAKENLEKLNYDKNKYIG